MFTFGSFIALSNGRCNEKVSLVVKSGLEDVLEKSFIPKTPKPQNPNVKLKLILNRKEGKLKVLRRTLVQSESLEQSLQNEVKFGSDVISLSLYQVLVPIIASHDLKSRS